MNHQVSILTFSGNEIDAKALANIITLLLSGMVAHFAG